MKLSKNFTLEELVFSITANNHGINNTPNAEAKAERKSAATLKQLAEVLTTEQIQALLNKIQDKTSESNNSEDI